MQPTTPDKDPVENYFAASIMQFFVYAHLPQHLQQVSRPFCQLAERLDRDLDGNPEKTMALRKLLEAKDCAVRAFLFKRD